MNLGDRMKLYERATRHYLPIRTPVIIRIDGRAFHTYTREAEKPFDPLLIQVFQETMMYLCENISGCVLGYHQSDEISLLLIDYQNHNTQAWFDNNLQKICSLSASMATAYFNTKMNSQAEIADMLGTGFNFPGLATFDSRAFPIPREDVANYFIWRQKDWERNSLQMLTRAHYSHKQCENKKRDDMHDMLHAVGVNWNDLDTHLKRGSCCIRNEVTEEVFVEGLGFEWITRNPWSIDMEIPIFTQSRGYIESLIYPEIYSEED